MARYLIKHRDSFTVALHDVITDVTTLHYITDVITDMKYK